MQITQNIECQPTITQAVNDLVRKKGLNNNLAVDWVNSEDRLKAAQDRGLMDLYCSVFAEPPYFEKFEKTEVHDYLNNLVSVAGILFAATTPEQPDQIIAFVASQPLETKESVAQALDGRINIDRACYFAEDAVAFDMRRRGISRNMKKLLMTANALMGYEKMVLRTSKDSIQQIAAVKQLGGMQVDGLYQDIPAKRLDGSVKTDRRIFFILDLAKCR